MAEMAQQTPLVIEVTDIDSAEITTEEKKKIRRAVVRGNGLNIVLKDAERKTQIIAQQIDGGSIEVGTTVIIVYYDAANSQIAELECGAITADDFSDDTPADE